MWNHSSSQSGHNMSFVRYMLGIIIITVNMYQYAWLGLGWSEYVLQPSFQLTWMSHDLVTGRGKPKPAPWLLTQTPSWWAPSHLHDFSHNEARVVTFLHETYPLNERAFAMCILLCPQGLKNTCPKITPYCRWFMVMSHIFKMNTNVVTATSPNYRMSKMFILIDK